MVSIELVSSRRVVNSASHMGLSQELCEAGQRESRGLPLPCLETWDGTLYITELLDKQTALRYGWNTALNSR